MPGTGGASGGGRIPRGRVLHRTRLSVVPVAALLAIAGLLALGGTAFAYFGLGAGGTGQVQAGTLDAPSGLVASGPVTRTTVPLQWTAPATVTAGYVVLRCSGSGCTPAVGDTLAAGGCAGTVTATGCSDTTAQAGVAYTYAVVAVDHQWTSGPSNSLAVTTPAPARLAVTPVQGAPGQEVHLTGTGFTTGGTLSATVDAAAGTLTNLSAVTPGGTWTATLALPDVPAGPATITATRQGGDTAWAPVTVVPAITLSATQGAPGSIVAVNGGGFTAGSPVTFSFAPQAGPVGRLTPTTCAPAATDAGGALPAGPLDLTACRITVPASAPPGPGTVTVTDGAGATATAPFAVSADKLVVTTPPVTGPAAATPGLGPITVERETATGAPLTTGALLVTLGANPPAGAIFATTSTGPSVGTVTIPAGASSATVWFGDSAPGTVTITAGAANFTTATQQEVVSAAEGLWLTAVSFGGGAPGTYGITCLPPAGGATTCSGTMPQSGSFTASVTFVTATGTPVAYSPTAAATLSAQVGHAHAVAGFPLAVPAGATTSATSLSATASGTTGVALTITSGPYTLHLDVSS